MGEREGEYGFDNDNPPEQPRSELPTVELPIAAVEADPDWNCREPYTEEQIEAAYRYFESVPMLHPPTVAPAASEGRYRVVAGFKRFAVLALRAARSGHEVATFRLVENLEEADLLLLNLAENMARDDVPGANVVDRVATLADEGMDLSHIAEVCHLSVRHVRRLCAIRRDAHPELWALFTAGHEGLSVRRMAALVGHDAERQMEELRRSEALLAQAREIEQGYSEELSVPEPSSTGVVKGRAERRRVRRRYPPRRNARRLLWAMQRNETLPEKYKEGFIAAMRHMLDGEDLPVSWNAVTEGAPKGA